ncbi:MAG: PSD1 and planctomycete cytochrome C domain-containing protein [Planctomycetota bacterium]|nr:PSD1 and planctomycete cytochrome C domain-containing protein [Planctomycetota bacterium]
MHRQKPLILFCQILLALWLARTIPAEEPIRYDRDVRPILANHCFACHGPDAAKREGELRLDQPVAADRGIIVAGRPARSELIKRVLSNDPDIRMPPPASRKQLSPAEIKVLSRWIDQGASHQRHWAYVAPTSDPPQAIQDLESLGTSIDHFVLARLITADLAPSGAADPATLIRRLSFDMTGLPPTISELDDFMSDPGLANYERHVDRLLASPAFGERLASYWLDLVRYASTVGYHGDQDHAIAPYRDWVIDAFNRNLPFDEFTINQLAGDLLPAATVDQQIATGYNRLLQTSHEGGVQPKEYLAIYAADRIRNFSVVWLAATVGCAQCHDHKYDPFTTRDFYSLQAFFADIDEATHFTRSGNTLPTLRAPELNVLSPHQRRRIEALETEIGALADGTDEDREKKVSVLREQVAAIQKATQRTMITAAIQPRMIHVLPRGDWLDESGPVVGPAVPSVLGQLETGGRRPTRLDLARWLTDPDDGIGGLTSRVFVNRIWYLLMGRGLAPDLGDLGNRSELPSHPLLLDYLRIDFYQPGGDITRLVKGIAMSETYKQSSQPAEAGMAADPENAWFSRQTRFRLPAEMIRDNALAVSGLLIREPMVGHSRPYQPEGYYRHLNFPVRRYAADKGPAQYRRAVYMHWQRQFLHPMLKAFDAPSREECTAQRLESNTPLAALVLMNDPTFVEAARALAITILDDGRKDDKQCIEELFLRVLSRVPRQGELQTMLQFLADCRENYEQNPELAARLLTVGMHPVPVEMDKVELASWSDLCRALLNVNESFTRN